MNGINTKVAPQSIEVLHKTIQKIIRYTVHTIAPKQIILFGSWSKGTQDIYSDIDLLVITDKSLDRKNLSKEINSYINELSLKSDVLIRTSSEIEMAKLIPLSFLGSILKEGKIIYKK